MRIGLLDIDSQTKAKGATIYPNLALCKIAAYHRQQGDTVEWAMPLFEHYDIIYRSKIFNFTQDDDRTYDTDLEIRGGTGYDIASRLPQEIDDCQPDYTIYPSIPTDTCQGCPVLQNARMIPKRFSAAHFTLGYPKKDDTERNLLVRIYKVTLGRGNPAWGAEPGKEYIIIHLDKTFKP